MSTPTRVKKAVHTDMLVKKRKEKTMLSSMIKEKLRVKLSFPLA